MKSIATMPAAPLRAVILAATLAGCAASNITTGSVNTEPGTSKRGTPVVTGKAARMYVISGFRENDCTALDPEIKITSPPAKGDIALNSGQTTYVQSSNSGKCVGKQIVGTGIYYTARPGQFGPDTFAITAIAGSGTPVTKTFQVEIVE